jgi:hypothetical protein
MAVDLTLKSVQLTNREATPKVMNNPGLGGGGREKVVVGHIASVTASLSITSVIRLVEVPANAVVTGLWFQSAAQTAGAFSIGVYRTPSDGGLVAFTSSDQFFATAISAASAVVLTDVLNESTTNTIAKQSQPLWQAIGMASNPNCMLDICAVVTTTDVTTGTGALGIKVRYVD